MPDSKTVTLRTSGIDSYAAHKTARYSMQGKIKFTFPDGLHQVDVLVKCRALNSLDSFEAMYNLTVLLLRGKAVTATWRNADGVQEELCRITASDWSNLRGIAAIDGCPVLIVWLTDAVAKHLSEEMQDAWEQSVAACGTGITGQQPDPFNTGETGGGSGGDYLVRTYFGDGLLYACYEFYDRFKHKPDDWAELFDFMRFMKVKNTQRELALATAKEGG
jgi:hypothetical protein